MQVTDYALAWRLLHAGLLVARSPMGKMSPAVQAQWCDTFPPEGRKEPLTCWPLAVSGHQFGVLEEV